LPGLRGLLAGIEAARVVLVKARQRIERCTGPAPKSAHLTLEGWNELSRIPLGRYDSAADDCS
jgi:hypothetical protein